MRELEDELGALLLNRTTRQFSLTEAGHTYYRRASEIVREVDNLADAVRESSGDVRGRIKLSAPRTFADAPIGQSLIDFAKEHPDIVLEIDLDDRFVDLVEEGFDLAIRITRLESSSLIARRLAPFSVQALRLAGTDRKAWHAEPPAGPRRTSPASSTPTAAGCPTGRSSATTADLVTRFGFRADRGQQSADGARGGAGRPRLRHPAGFHRRPGDREAAGW